MPWLGVLGGLGVAIWSVYWDYRRRIPNAKVRATTEVFRPAFDGSRAQARLSTALVLVALGWVGRYAADRFGGWLALIGYGFLAVGIAMLAHHVAVRVSSAPPEDGKG